MKRLVKETVMMFPAKNLRESIQALLACQPKNTLQA
jgi:hypothetical protein